METGGVPGGVHGAGGVETAVAGRMEVVGGRVIVRTDTRDRIILEGDIDLVVPDL